MSLSNICQIWKNSKRTGNGERVVRKRIREEEVKENVERKKEYDRLEQCRRRSLAELESLDAQCVYINDQLNQLVIARDSCKDDDMALI